MAISVKLEAARVAREQKRLGENSAPHGTKFRSLGEL
jgi:hypothetical protein